MATNKNALIRYKTIDRCLQNRSRRWTLQDLIDTCSDALYEYEGKDTYLGKRTIQLDIQNMRSDKLGYNAPIICYDRKYYTYEDENYSITKLPVSVMDMDILKESMIVLSQFKDFSLFKELNGMIQKLEDKVYRQNGSDKSIIYMDRNDQLKGLEYLEPIYQSILKKIVLSLDYQSFKSRSKNTIKLHPFLLREFNNRWFIIGKNEKTHKLMTLALDRIQALDLDLSIDYDNRTEFDANDYFKDTIGVTVLNTEPENIVLKFDGNNAPYVLTKPFHSSQEVIEQHDDKSVTIQIKVHQNFELERLILGFGEGVKVISPRKLRNRIKKKLGYAIVRYEEEGR